MSTSTTKTPVIVSAVTVAGVAWYALVEGVYFYLHGPRLRAAFARANAGVGDGRGAAFPRMPWLGAVVYAVLVLAHALLSVWPALRGCGFSSCVSGGAAARTTRPSPSTAYVACLWRAVLLSAAVYATYDLVTYITVLPFEAGAMMWDMFYGVVVLPCAVVAPVAATLAACLRRE